MNFSSVSIEHAGSCRSENVQLLADTHKCRPLIRINVPGLFHDVVNFGRTAFWRFHTVTFFDVLYNVR